MQNLDGDLKRALLDTLCASWKVRKATIDRVFVEDAQFWCASGLPALPVQGVALCTHSEGMQLLSVHLHRHLFHNVRGIKNIHGIYQVSTAQHDAPAQFLLLAAC